MPVYEKVMFSVITALFAACYIISAIVGDGVFSYLKYIPVLLVIVYTVVIMSLNYTKSEQKSVRAVSVTIISVSALVILLFAFSLFKKHNRISPAMLIAAIPTNMIM